MTFEFATAARIVFGAGSLNGIGALARGFGSHALVVCGRNAERAHRLIELLGAAGVTATVFRVPGEPTTDDVIRGVGFARAGQCELVIGQGGGSALDAAKAISALLTNPGDPTDYLEVVGKGQALQHAAAPCIAIPTTSGTGAEVTRNAVLASREHRVKVSLRSALMLPRVALVDPELTYGLPPAITAATGFDALTQLIEPYVSSRANPLTDALCVDGLRRVARSLRRAVEHGADPAAREDMALASLYGGLALANAGLGAVHGFAGPIGGAFPAPHGAVCAALLPHATAMNLHALRQRAPESPLLRKYDEVARLLTGRSQASSDDGVAWLEQMVGALGIPRLATYGLKPSDTADLVGAAMKASSMKANPLPLTPDECREILERAS
ncbi:iron-containing alcohol dehydrogenase [Opitutus sp. ER46]|uniref:iron-containing alcohol dehydrogenase n=1 Tax=Opitutus sp. ER46 TaxID=2161864 RepID=UPI000D3196BB|nr:iron-containing alcohol dehydrogenase [Opitutus sp. ER46]PTX95726.1 alcohol dehydrogenase [Opitutus sp. ER46]